MVCNVTSLAIAFIPFHAITSLASAFVNPVGVANDATNSASTKHLARTAHQNANVRMMLHVTHTTGHAIVRPGGLVMYVTSRVMMVTMAMDVTPHACYVNMLLVSVIETQESVHVRPVSLALTATRLVHRIILDFSVNHVHARTERRVNT